MTEKPTLETLVTKFLELIIDERDLREHFSQPEIDFLEQVFSHFRSDRNRASCGRCQALLSGFPKKSLSENYQSVALNELSQALKTITLQELLLKLITLTKSHNLLDNPAKLTEYCFKIMQVAEDIEYRTLPKNSHMRLDS